MAGKEFTLSVSDFARQYKKIRSSSGEMYIHKRANGYAVEIKRQYLGTYKTIEEAKRVRDEYLKTK
jgi:hypothetical protein